MDHKYSKRWITNRNSGPQALIRRCSRPPHDSGRAFQFAFVSRQTGKATREREEEDNYRALVAQILPGSYLTFSDEFVSEMGPGSQLGGSMKTLKPPHVIPGSSGDTFRLSRAQSPTTCTYVVAEAALEW